MRETASSLGYFLGSLAPLLIGIGVSFYLRKKRGEDKLPGWPIIIGLVLTILSCVGATNSRATAAPASSAANQGAQVKSLWAAVSAADEKRFEALVTPGARLEFQRAVKEDVTSSALSLASLQPFVRVCHISNWGSSVDVDEGKVWLLIWSCPQEKRGLVFHFDDSRISRVEDIPVPPPLVSVPEPPAIFPSERGKN